MTMRLNKEEKELLDKYRGILISLLQKNNGEMLIEVNENADRYLIANRIEIDNVNQRMFVRLKLIELQNKTVLQ